MEGILQKCHQKRNMIVEYLNVMPLLKLDFNSLSAYF